MSWRWLAVASWEDLSSFPWKLSEIIYVGNYARIAMTIYLVTLQIPTIRYVDNNIRFALTKLQVQHRYVNPAVTLP